MENHDEDNNVLEENHVRISIVKPDLNFSSNDPSAEMFQTDTSSSENLSDSCQMKHHSKKEKYSLQQTLYKIRKYRWLHKRTSEYYDRINNYLTAPTIFISAIATVLTVAEINSVVLASIVGLSTTLIGLSTYLKLGSKHMNHLVAAEGYDNLVTMIDFEIKFPDQCIRKFAANIEKKILEIKKTVHFLAPEFIYREYVKMHQKDE